MDERFERQLRAGLADLLDPMGGAYPEWTTSPAARLAAETAPLPAPLPWWPAGWSPVRPATLRLVLAAILVLAVAAAALLWYRPGIFVTGPTHTPSPAPSMTPLTTGTTIVVTSTAMTVDPDDGLCTLPEAITAANDDRPSGAAPGECPGGDGADRVELSAGATYELSQSNAPFAWRLVGRPELQVSSDIAVASGGDAPATVSNSMGRRGIFQVSTAGRLILANLTIDGGGGINTDTWYGEGGAIQSSGALVIDHCTFHDNDAPWDGGAIAVLAGSLSVTGSTFTGNHAVYGGAISAVAESSTLAIDSSTFSDNIADESGGAIWFGGASSGPGDLIVIGSTFTQNDAQENGGAIFTSGRLTASLTTLARNHARYGGGIYNAAGQATVERSALAQNEADAAGGAVAATNGSTTLGNSTVGANTARDGGGVFSTGRLTLWGSTLYDNVAERGSGVWSPDWGENSSVSVEGSIVASGSGASCGGGRTISDQGYNLSSDASCGFTAEGSRQNVDPRLGWLGDNGGPTQSYAPLPGSPAIDAIPADDLPAYPATDQRGVARPQDGDGDGIAGADIGAVEVEPQWDAVVLPATLAPGSDVPLRLDPLIGVSHDEAWGVDADGSVWHYAHGAWSGAPGPAGIIRDLLYSPDGTLWIATADGAFVQQGTMWVRVDWRPTRGLAVDRTGAVWATPLWTTSWDARAYARTGAIWAEQRRTASTDAILEPAQVAVGLDGTVWVGSSGYGYRPGLVRYVDGTWEKVEIRGDTPFRVMDLATAPNGDVWVAGGDLKLISPGGTTAAWTEDLPVWIARFDGTSWEVYDGTHGPQVPALALDAAPDGTIWAATAGGLRGFDGTSWSTLYPATGFTDVSVAPDGTVWAMGSTGVGRFLPTSASE